MTERGTRRLAWTLFAVEMVMAAVSIWFTLLDRKTATGAWEGGLLGDISFAVAFVLTFPVIGVVLATRRPHNALGWLMLGIGFFATEPLSSYGQHALAVNGAGAVQAIAATSWTWMPVIGLAGTFVLLLFPDGHLPSPRWRWFARTVAVGIAVTSLAILLMPGSLEESGYPNLQNPFGVESLRLPLDIASAAIFTLPVGLLGSALSLVLRYRRSAALERLQLKWLAGAAVVVAVLMTAAMVLTAIVPDAEWTPVLQGAAVLSFGLLPVSIGIAVLRYRLYDIDVVIRKAVVVAGIAIFFTAVYASIVGGIGALVESRATTTLSFLAAAVVAALFQPVLGRARRIADRVVYGRRATPYEVLAEFSERVAETYADDDVLPRMARVVGEGIGASRADVWLKVDDRLRVSASWPPESDRPAPVALGDGRLPALPAGDAAFPVEHRGELLGALTVAMPASDPMDDAKSKLVADLASQAGLVLRNVRLTEDLRARFEDLKAAQKRIVTAQDEARRRLERNIHDGAQQQLVALTVKLRLAQGFVQKDPARAESMLVDLQGETQAALEDLRDLARGIYPPLLADQGIVAALTAQARKAAMPVEVVGSADVGRYPQEVEAAAYFCSLEALQNVAKYANASRVEVRIGHDGSALTFEVTDDGDGFDQTTTTFGTGLQGMADRLAALDGTLEVRSTPGAGTTVAARIPVTPSGLETTHDVPDRTTAGV